MRLVRTATGDFSEEELSATKERLGRSTRTSPPAGPGRLRPRSAQAPAERGVHGLPAPAKLAPERGMRSRGTLSGATTPGCGRSWPGSPGGCSTWAAGGGVPGGARRRRAAGEVADTCVDPDAARAPCSPPGTPSPLRRCPCGDFASDLGTFDHVLIPPQREPPRRPDPRLLSRARPAGAGRPITSGRERPQTRAAERAEPPPRRQRGVRPRPKRLARGARRGRARDLLEHYRNDGAAEADLAVRRALESLPNPPAIRLVERRDVGPETSNQWLLRYQ